MAHGSLPMEYGIRHNLVIWCKFDTRQQSDKKAQLDKGNEMSEFNVLTPALNRLINIP